MAGVGGGRRTRSKSGSQSFVKEADKKSICFYIAECGRGLCGRGRLSGVSDEHLTCLPLSRVTPTAATKCYKSHARGPEMSFQFWFHSPPSAFVFYIFVSIR